MSGLPRVCRGRRSSAAQAIYDAEVRAFCETILEIRSTLDFEISTRGWCYILEGQGVVTKGDFDRAERIINDCRKSGLLPLNICAVDSTRVAENLEQIDGGIVDEVDAWIAALESAHENYRPLSFWQNQNCYIEMAVEKIDLKSLFGPVCAQFCVPIQNVKGWADINGRAAMMKRFRHWEGQGKQCVLLYCGDFDPGGLSISDFLHSNLKDMQPATGWNPDILIVERFGLDFDFIEANGLTWIDNLETSSGGNLADPKHPDHFKPYVQTYLARYGARKCEANALVIRPDEGRQLCGNAILRHVDMDARDDYAVRLGLEREALRRAIIDRLREGAA